MKNKSYTPDQINQMWDYRNSVITYFNGFVSSFLVAESVLLAVIGMISSSNSSMANIKIPIIIMGFILTLLWLYVQAKQRFIIKNIKKDCIENIEWYQIQQEIRERSLWRFSTTWLLTFMLPLLFAVIWIFVLYAVL